MTNANRLSTLRCGLHSSVSDFTSTPTLTTLQPTDGAESFLRRMRNEITRNLSSTDGRRFPRAFGGKDVSPLSLNLEFKGANANTGGAVSDWEAKLEQGALLASFFGAVATATSGAATTVDSTGHTPGSGILQVVSGTNVPVGAVIAFPTTVGMQIGQVASKATNVLTLASAYSGTPTTGATVTRMGVYSVDQDKTEHKHVMFSAEQNVEATGNLRTDYFGCAPMSMELNFPNTGLVGFASQWGPTSWDSIAPGSPSFAAPTAGNPCVVDGLTFKIGGTAYVARNAKLRFDNGTVMREAGSNVNGVLGGVCGASGPKTTILEAELYFGGGGAIAEILEATGTIDLGDMDGTDSNAGDIATTYNVEIFNGAAANGLLYGRLPGAEIKATVGQANGMTIVRLTATNTGATGATLAVG